MKRLAGGAFVDVVHGRKDKYTSVLFCGSGTICMDVCLNSLLPEGRTILIVDNGAYSSRGAEICEYYGLPHIRLRLPIDRPIDPEAVEAALRSHPDIGVVYTTHHETGTGVLNPVRELGALVHRYGGGLYRGHHLQLRHDPDRHRKDNIDFCMASAQKGIMGMTACPTLLGTWALIERSAAYPKRSYYCNLYLQYSFFETTGEMHFTRPFRWCMPPHRRSENILRRGIPQVGAASAGLRRHPQAGGARLPGSDPAGISVVAGCQRPVSRRSPLEF